MTAEIVHADGAFAIGTCGGVVVMVWRGEGTPERVHVASGLVRAHAVANGGKVGIVSVIEEGAPDPGAAAQRELARDMRSLAPSMAATAFVLEGGGESAKRKLEVWFVIDALRERILRQKYCHGTIEAASWVVMQSRGVRDVPTREALVDAIACVRGAIGDPDA